MRVLTESQRHGAVHRTAEGAINLGQLQAADRGVQSGLPPLRASGDDMPAASVAEPPFGQAEGDLPRGLDGRDALILQYLNNLTIDYSLLAPFSGEAQKLLAYVRQQDPGMRQ